MAPLLGDKRVLLTLGILIIVVAAGGINLLGLNRQQKTDLPKYYPTQGWRTAKPEETGLDADILASMVTDIKASNTQTRSSIVVYEGYIVVEEYYNGFKREDQQSLYSCTKTVISTLVGIAIAEGKIGSVNEKLPDLLPNTAIEPWRW